MHQVRAHHRVIVFREADSIGVVERRELSGHPQNPITSLNITHHDASCGSSHRKYSRYFALL